MRKWYYVTPDRTHEEFLEDEAAGLVDSGAIQPATLIWNDSMSDWRPAGEVMPAWFGEGGEDTGASTDADGEVQAGLYDSGIDPSKLDLTKQDTPTGAAPGNPPTLTRSSQEDPLAITSLICGIAGAVLLLMGCLFICFSFLGFISAIAAIVTGHMSLSQMKQTGNTQARSFALTGVICGYATLGIGLIGIAAMAIIAGAAGLEGM